MDDGEAESGISYLDEINLADSLQEETQNGHGNAFIFDTASKQYDLQNAVYKGIANFLKGMECQEAGQVMVNLLRFSKIMYAENVMVNGYEYPSGTMFDRVISENIQF